MSSRIPLRRTAPATISQQIRFAPDGRPIPPRTRVWAPLLERFGSVLLADRRGAVALAAGLVGLIAIMDAATEFEIRLAVLYLLPVFLATWTAGRLAGFMIAVLAVITWIAILQASHTDSDHLYYYYWDGAILMSTLTVFVLILARLRSALESADQRFATVLEGLDAAIYVNDRESILYVNRRFRDFFEAGSEEVGTRDFERRFDVPPSEYFDPSAGPSSEPQNLRGEFQERGSRRWFLVHARAVTWVDGRVVSLKVMADITEAKQAHEANRQQMEKLQMSARLLTIGEIASGLAHELNQPLTAIASYNQACLKLLRAPRAAEHAELLGYMEKCGAQAVRAGGIINRMREYARKREPLRGPNDVNAIVQEAVKLLDVEAEMHGVTIAQALAPGMPLVMADVIMIEQVLLNLVRNAIEAMRDCATEQRVVRIVSADLGEAVQLSVHDSGHGVPSEVAANLFTPFFSTKHDGMGIGLNISRSIVELHGGMLWYEPAPSGGAIFFFTLPVAAP